MPAPPRAPANVEKQMGSAAANPLTSEDEQHPLDNNLMKYMMQSLTQWQVNKIKEFANDTEVIILLEEWQITREENMQLMDLVMEGQVKAHELSRQLSVRLADLENEAADKMRLQAQAVSLPPDNVNAETSDDRPPAAKAGKIEAAGSPLNPGGRTAKAPPPVIPPKEARAKLDADTDAGRDPANRPIAVSEPQSRGEVTHCWNQAERARKEREDKEAESRIRQDKIRRELREYWDRWSTRQDVEAKATATPSPTSPAEEEEEVTHPPVNQFEELVSDSKVDIEKELTEHPEWADEVRQAGDVAVKWAENQNCSYAMQISAASPRRERVQKLRNDAERALQANRDAGKRAPSTGDTTTSAPEAPGPASNDQSPTDSDLAYYGKDPRFWSRDTTPTSNCEVDPWSMTEQDIQQVLEDTRKWEEQRQLESSEV